MELEQYPIKTESRNIYARTPIKVTQHAIEFYRDHIDTPNVFSNGVTHVHESFYMAGNILKTGGAHYIGSPTFYEKKEECQEQCDIWNIAQGFEPEFIQRVLAISFGGTINNIMSGKMRSIKRPERTEKKPVSQGRHARRKAANKKK